MARFRSILPYFLPLSFVVVCMIAFKLTPAAEGLGTHQQLGLPPCFFYHLTGIPCPGCGLTTSFTHLAHGNFISAFKVNPMGPFLFLAYAFLSLSVLLRKNLDQMIFSKYGNRISMSFIIIFLASWVLRISNQFLNFIPN